MEGNCESEDRVVQWGDRSAPELSCLAPHTAHSCRSIDTSEAQKVPGFVCFISADDVPGSNQTGVANDETIFAKDKVCLRFLKNIKSVELSEY